MASKEILFDAKAREKLSRGVDKLANAVKVLLRAGTENLAVELEGKGQELRKLLGRPESGKGSATP